MGFLGCHRRSPGKSFGWCQYHSRVPRNQIWSEAFPGRIRAYPYTHLFSFTSFNWAFHFIFLIFECPWFQVLLSNLAVFLFLQCHLVIGLLFTPSIVLFELFYYSVTFEFLNLLVLIQYFGAFYDTFRLSFGWWLRIYTILVIFQYFTL